MNLRYSFSDIPQDLAKAFANLEYLPVKRGAHFLAKPLPAAISSFQKDTAASEAIIKRSSNLPAVTTAFGDTPDFFINSRPRSLRPKPYLGSRINIEKSFSLLDVPIDTSSKCFSK